MIEYMNTKSSRNYTDIVLRKWQQDALKLIDSPSDRKVIWITGTKGNEGKSWFQGYLKHLYGYNRVFQVDLRTNHRDVCNILRKKPLPTLDIFLFNDARSDTVGIHDAYKVLENIKDGEATSSKFDNDIIRFRTPNIVMIFSNKYPTMDKLSRDRWIVFNANQGGLNDVTRKCAKGYEQPRKDRIDYNDYSHFRRRNRDSAE